MRGKKRAPTRKFMWKESTTKLCTHIAGHQLFNCTGSFLTCQEFSRGTKLFTHRFHTELNTPTYSNCGRQENCCSNSCIE